MAWDSVFAAGSQLVAQTGVPDGEAAIPPGLRDKLGTIAGWAKGIGFFVLAVALVGVAVQLAVSRSRGEGVMESGGGFLRVAIAVAVVSASFSIVGALV